MQINVNNQYRIYRRKNRVFYLQDNRTGKQTSLNTKDKREAQRILHAKNEATVQPTLNLQIARVYLTAADEAYTNRTWQDVMNSALTGKKASTAERWIRACQP